MVQVNSPVLVLAADDQVKLRSPLDSCGSCSTESRKLFR